MSAPETIWDLRDVLGAPRYYSPGRHPAMWRHRQHARKLEGLPPSPERDGALAYVRQQMANFEAQEAECKMRDHEMLARFRETR